LSGLLEVKVFEEKVFEKDIRCKRCKRLLMKGEVLVVEIKCPKCGYIQVLKSLRG